MPNSGITLILAVLFAAGFFCFFYPQIENFFVFFPRERLDSVPSDWGLRYEDVYFDTEDKKRLHGWFFPHKEEAPVVLFCHGNAGNISHRLDNIRLLLNQKLQVFIFDYRGYGKSAGRPSEKGLYHDGLAAYDYLVKGRHIRPDKIVLFGRSLGTCVAVEIALKKDVRSLIIESAFTSTKEMAKTMSLFRFFSFLLPPHYNNLEKIPRVTVPKLIIHGEDDDIVPFSMGKKLFHVAHTPKYFFPIKKADHNDTYLVGGKQYFETLVEFIKNSNI